MLILSMGEDNISQWEGIIWPENVFHGKVQISDASGNCELSGDSSPFPCTLLCSGPTFQRFGRQRERSE